MLRDDLVVANVYRVERINEFSVTSIDHCFVGELFDQLQIDHWDQTLSVPFKANSPRNSSFSRARTQRVFTRRSTRKGNFKASDCATLLLRFNEEREKKDGKQIVVSKCITCCCCKVQAIRIWVVVNFCIFRNIVLRMLRFRLGIYLFPLFHIRAAEAKAMKMRSTLNGLETMRRASLKISDFFPIKLHSRIMFLLSARLSRSSCIIFNLQISKFLDNVKGNPSTLKIYDVGKDVRGFIRANEFNLNFFLHCNCFWQFFECRKGQISISNEVVEKVTELSCIT